MKTSPSILSLAGSCLLCVSASAQTPPASPAEVPARADAPVVAAAVDIRARPPVRDLRLVTAAGSVIVLADGVVAQARIAQVQPPAAGFVYER